MATPLTGPTIGCNTQITHAHLLTYHHVRRTYQQESPFDNSIAGHYHYATMPQARVVWDERQGLRETCQYQPWLANKRLTFDPITFRFELGE